MTEKEETERRHAEEVARDWTFSRGWEPCPNGMECAEGCDSHTLADLIQRERALAHDAALFVAAEVVPARLAHSPIYFGTPTWESPRFSEGQLELVRQAIRSLANPRP